MPSTGGLADSPRPSAGYYALGVSPVVGRESEIAVVESFLTEDDRRPAHARDRRRAGDRQDRLVWEEAVRLARESGAVVLVSRPAESEAQLSFAGLTDLLSSVASERRRSRCRHRSVRRSTSRCSAPEAEPCRPQRRLLGHRGALARPGAGRRRRRSSLAVDDLHWLDTSLGGRESGFALRRLGPEPARARLVGCAPSRRRCDRSGARAVDERDGPTGSSSGPFPSPRLHRVLVAGPRVGRSAADARPDRPGARRRRPAVCARDRPASRPRGDSTA